MRIADIPIYNQPRERLRKHGASVLSSAELLAVVFGSGSRNENAIDMSNRLIAKYGLEKLASCSLAELCSIPGIGPAKAMQLVALFAFANRVKSSPGKVISNAKDVFDYLSPKMAGLKQEHFVVLLLDTKNAVIKEETIALGTLNSALIHPREVFRSAIKESANAVILVHNHPSGDATPSDEDVRVTEQLIEAGKLVGIKVVDHVIIGKDYLSLIQPL